MKIFRLFGLATLIVGVAAVGSACTPQPEPTDTTGPVLELPSTAAFTTGSIIATGDPSSGWNDAGFSSAIPASIEWSATDNGSGVCNYDVEEIYAGMAPSLVLEKTSATSYVTTETDYDDQFGGGSSKVVGWNVTARDCAGNTTTAFVDGGPYVIQEDGANVSDHWNDVAPTYEGTWVTNSCGCWSNGTAAQTSQDGSTAVFTALSKRVALVMDRGPDQGMAQILVNGIARAVVDNGAPAASNRVIVWEGPVEPGDEVTVVNLATSGRPTITLDAIIIR